MILERVMRVGVEILFVLLVQCFMVRPSRSEATIPRTRSLYQQNSETGTDFQDAEYVRNEKAGSPHIYSINGDYKQVPVKKEPAIPDFTEPQPLFPEGNQKNSLIDYVPKVLPNGERFVSPGSVNNLDDQREDAKKPSFHESTPPPQFNLDISNSDDYNPVYSVSKEIKDIEDNPQDHTALYNPQLSLNPPHDLSEEFNISSSSFPSQEEVAGENNSVITPLNLDGITRSVVQHYADHLDDDANDRPQYPTGAIFPDVSQHLDSIVTNVTLDEKNSNNTPVPQRDQQYQDHGIQNSMIDDVASEVHQITPIQAHFQTDVHDINIQLPPKQEMFESNERVLPDNQGQNIDNFNNHGLEPTHSDETLNDYDTKDESSGDESTMSPPVIYHQEDDDAASTVSEPSQSGVTSDKYDTSDDNEEVESTTSSQEKYSEEEMEIKSSSHRGFVGTRDETTASLDHAALATEEILVQEDSEDNSSPPEADLEDPTTRLQEPNGLKTKENTDEIVESDSMIDVEASEVHQITPIQAHLQTDVHDINIQLPPEQEMFESNERVLPENQGQPIDNFNNPGLEPTHDDETPDEYDTDDESKGDKFITSSPVIHHLADDESASLELSQSGKTADKYDASDDNKEVESTTSSEEKYSEEEVETKSPSHEGFMETRDETTASPDDVALATEGIPVQNDSEDSSYPPEADLKDTTTRPQGPNGLESEEHEVITDEIAHEGPLKDEASTMAISDMQEYTDAMDKDEGHTDNLESLFKDETTEVELGDEYEQGDKNDIFNLKEDFARDERQRESVFIADEEKFIEKSSHGTILPMLMLLFVLLLLLMLCYRMPSFLYSTWISFRAKCARFPMSRQWRKSRYSIVPMGDKSV